MTFPWYKNPHPHTGTGAPTLFSTEDLTSTERQALEARMISSAEQMAYQVFGKKYDGIIPGSIISSKDQADAIRSLTACWTRGKWVRREKPTSLLRHFQDPLYGSCDNRFYKSHDRKSQWRDPVQYVWEPSCPLPVEMVDPQKWCETLAGRSILIVGDLVQYQIHELLLDVMRDGPVVCYGELNCKDHTICNAPKTSNLRYLRNDVLSTNRVMDNAHGHPAVNVVRWPFVAAHILRDYEIFILNRGPVLEDDTEFINQLLDAVQTLRRLKPRALIIYRSSSIGHPHCDDADGPLSAPLTDDQLRQLPYGWGEQSRRNAIARTIVEAAGGLFVDLAYLTDLRPDGHIGGQDCLRYCIPGPADAWATILYNVMLGLEGALPLPEDRV
ncbi:hypothetical protein BX666DRAFT_1880914 [Dichotomocladium elegans]|nr:hypothetical protein BX666DRAFT_1880914 [Dichotomocladium elegans]